jgi:NTE family protein
MKELTNKKVGVVFSSGFFGFFAHAGCFAALKELGINPIGYSGTSSGAILAACAATGMNINAIKNLLFSLKKEDFWDPEPWYKTAIAALTFLKGWTGYLEGEKFKRLLVNALPLQRFEELTIPCVIVGCNLSRYKKEVFTTGSIAEAVQASGTIPWVFKLKNIRGDFFLDGGLVDKVPLEELAERINPEAIIVHYVSSQSLKEKENAFLSKIFSPQKAYTLSMDIVRQEHYRSQIKLVQQRGIRVIELKPTLPPVTPDSLGLGRAAYEASYSCTMATLGSDSALRK